MRHTKGSRFLLNRWGFAALAVCACLFGCGGGTSGTDGGVPVRVLGVVHDTEGMVIPGATVTVEESGDQTVTAVDGSFELSTSVAGPEATVRVEIAEIDGQATIVVPGTPSSITLDVTVSSGSGTVLATIVSITPIGTPAPTAVPNPQTTPRSTPRPVQPDLQSVVTGYVRSGTAPLPGVEISLRGLGTSGRTDSDGAFRLSFEPGPRVLNFELEGAGAYAAATLRGIPEQAVRIEIIFQILPSATSGQSAEAAIESVNIVRRR